MRRALLTAALLLALAGSLSACGGDEPAATRSPSTSPSGSTSTSPAATGTPSATPSLDASLDCAAVFSQAQAEKLAGEKLDAPEKQPFSGLTSCRWDAVGSDDWVQVLAVPASEWAKILPAAIGTVLDSGMDFAGKDQLDQALALIKNGGTLTDPDACGVFSTMVSSLQGQPKGTTKVYNYVPDDQAPQAVNGQACVRGRYYSVQWAKADLQPSAAVSARIQAALSAAIG